MVDLAVRWRAGLPRVALYLIALAILHAASAGQPMPPLATQATQEHSTPTFAGAGGQLSTDIHTSSVRVGVDLVLVPVTVVDAKNQPVTNLEEDNFVIYEDEKQQAIRYFSKDDQPISVGLILDLSSSMSSKIGRERAAVSEFLKSANSQDDYFVIGVSSRPRIVSDSTKSADRIEAKLALETPQGTTALLDAVYLALSKMRSAQYERRALLIISDGGDNNSRYRLKQIKELAEEADVQIYAIGLFDTALFKPFEELMGKKWLEEITDATGGRTLVLDNLDRLSEAAASISWELRNQYQIAYRPEKPGQRKRKRVIKVKVVPSRNPALHLAYKKSYFVPAE